MKQEILLEEIKKILSNSTADSLQKNSEENISPYPDILPVILHKLKNKLTPILGYSQILQMKNTDDLLTDKISRIERNAIELTELFDNLKDSLPIKKPAMRNCSINELIMSEQTLFQSVRENGLSIKLELGKDLPLAPLNTRQISLLIRNAVQNSITGIIIKGSGNGEITITSGQDEGIIYLKIRDNGCGIRMADINNIWTPFFSRFPGRGGIGLLIVEQVISDHTGKYIVESKEGVFTEFTFEFPLKGIDPADKTNQKTNALFIGFTEEEIGIIKKVSGDNTSLNIEETELTEPDGNKDICDLIFINSDITGSEDLKYLLQKTIEKRPDTDFTMFYSGEFPGHLIDIFDKENVKVVPDRTKLLTIINILARAINKEE